MKSSKDFVLKKALSLVKQKRKRFYRLWWTQWDKHDVCSTSQLTRFLNGIMFEPIENPTLFAELNMVDYALRRLGVELNTWDYLIKIHKKYRPRFIKYYLSPMVRRNGGLFPHMGKTDAIKEFIARGFVHEDEVKLDKLNNCWIKCQIAPLVWPKDFYQHQDALQEMDKIGIPGYTGTVLPNKTFRP